MDESAIRQGHLVKLRDDLDAASLRSLAEERIVPGVAYRVLFVEPGNEALKHESEDLLWIGENKFSPKEIEEFDPVISLDDDDVSLYDEVVPIGLSFVERLYD